MELGSACEAAGLVVCGKGLSGTDWLRLIWEPQDDALNCRGILACGIVPGARQCRLNGVDKYLLEAEMLSER